MNFRMNAFVSGSFFLFLFVGFIMLYENYYKTNHQKELYKHAEVISDSLWNYYHLGAAKYLQLAADLKRYENLIVKDVDGEVFISVNGKLPGELDQWLLSAGLIYIEDQSVNIFKNNKPIGKLIVRSRHDTIYTYGYVFCIIVLLFAIYILFFQIVKSKRLLEIRVENRTKELSKTVLRLKKEGLKRERAENELKWELDLNKARVDISKFLLYQQYNIGEISEITLKYASELTKELRRRFSENV